MPIATASFQTAKASAYLQQLFKHFAHKVDVEYTEAQGIATLPGGRVELSASETALAIQILAEDAKGLTQARYILEDHLVRFAFREKLIGLHWQYQP